jgi:hypothetical protein
MLNLSGLFTREALIATLRILPALKTRVMDTFFTERINHPLPRVSVDIVNAVAAELPVVMRGAPSVPAISESGSVNDYTPLAVRPSKDITGADLNDLKALDRGGLEAWSRTQTDFLRRAVRKTSEAMCGLALGGKVSWPVKLQDGGWEVYEIDYGSVQSVVPDVLLDDSSAKVMDVYKLLQALEEALNDNGYSDIEFLAGKDVNSAILKLVEGYTSTVKNRIEVSPTDDGIIIGGYTVKRFTQKYKNPQTGAATSLLADNKIRAVAKDAGHRLVYAAIDDLDGNLQALPFFVKPIKGNGDPSGYKLVAESKPFPVVNVAGIAEATATS